METNKLSLKYRVVIYPDFDYEIGDAEDVAEVQAILESDGAWGYSVEVSDSEDEHGYRLWDEIDSCFGFLGDEANSDYMMEQALANVPAGVEVPVYQHSEYSGLNHINDMVGTGK